MLLLQISTLTGTAEIVTYRRPCLSVLIAIRHAACLLVMFCEKVIVSKSLQMLTCQPDTARHVWRHGLIAGRASERRSRKRPTAVLARRWSHLLRYQPMSVSIYQLARSRALVLLGPLRALCTGPLNGYEQTLYYFIPLDKYAKFNAHKWNMISHGSSAIDAPFKLQAIHQPAYPLRRLACGY